MIVALDGVIRRYDWGSTTAIPQLLGLEPDGRPAAELWFGPHPDDPSPTVDGATLDTVIDADPSGALGAGVLDALGPRLPFLLKILAAEEPLSLQAHPSAAQAEAGYAREEAAGIPRTAAERNYPDPLPKPELLCALTEFHALAGFRDAAETVRLLRALGAPTLASYTQLLAAQPDADGLRAVFTTWITLPQRAVDDLVPALLDACVAHVRDHGEFTREARTLLDLGERYPGDAGVLAALLLNRVVLAPGQCLYQPAGSPHSYLAGCGVELMANSDNVLRCGLTPKHVDVPELLRVLDFTAGPPALIEPVGGTGPVTAYAGDSENFRLVRCAFAGAETAGDPGGQDHDVPAGGPRIVVCVEGAIRLRTERGQDRVLPRGRSMWVPACDGELSVSPDPATPGPALAFTAADGLS